MIPYSWIKTEYANPGSENYAFVPNQTLPRHSIGGRGNLTVGQVNAYQPIQPIILHAVPTSGYGGLAAGQFVQQPLVDTR